jgi:hypothetical protein
MPDRLVLLRERADTLTGLDFARIQSARAPVVLHVYFLTDPRAITPAWSLPSASAIALRSASHTLEVDPSVAPRLELDAAVDRPYLVLQLAGEPTLDTYTLCIDDPFVDPFFADVEVSFARECLGGDCRAEDEPCPPSELDEPLLDHLARDFVSLRGAMLDFLAQRHPKWAHESDADVGVTVVELLAALGDELAYVQDRYAREAYLRTATQRRSLRRLVRMVDFEVHDGRVGSTWLDVRVAPVPYAALDVTGARAYALSSVDAPIAFEAIDDPDLGAVVHPAWNLGALVPHFGHDERRRVLPCGADLIAVERPRVDAGDGFDAGALLVGRPLLFDAPEGRHLAFVRALLPALDGTSVHRDPLLALDFHRLVFEPPLPFAIDQTTLRLGANLVRVREGEGHEALFVVGEPAEGEAPWVHPTVVREGPRYGLGPDDLGPSAVIARQDGLSSERARPWIHRVSLPGSDRAPLGWVGDHLRDTLPELVLSELRDDVVLPREPRPIAASELAPTVWTYRPTLLDSGSDDADFTLEDGTWRRVVGYVAPDGAEHVHRDYATGRGTTLRFGDGVFGAAPPLGQRFVMRWRSTVGELANVGPDAITALEVPPLGVARSFSSRVEAVRNPFAVHDARDLESHDDIRLSAPHAWRTRLFATRPEDYAEQAERLPWVQDATADVRWTGSWSVMRVAVDPLASSDEATRAVLSRTAARTTRRHVAGAARLNDASRTELVGLLDAVRQAGREVLVREPRFLVLDLRVRICVERAFVAEVVERAVYEALVGPRVPGRASPFFHPDRFTFGTWLDRARLEHAIHAVPGVHAVTDLQLGVRGLRALAPLELRFAPPEGMFVLRLGGDRSRPEHGTLVVEAENAV